MGTRCYPQEAICVPVGVVPEHGPGEMQVALRAAHRGVIRSPPTPPAACSRRARRLQASPLSAASVSPSDAPTY